MTPRFAGQTDEPSAFIGDSTCELYSWLVLTTGPPTCCVDDVSLGRFRDHVPTSGVPSLAWAADAPSTTAPAAVVNATVPSRYLLVKIFIDPIFFPPAQTAGFSLRRSAGRWHAPVRTAPGRLAPRCCVARAGLGPAARAVRPRHPPPWRANYCGLVVRGAGTR